MKSSKIKFAVAAAFCAAFLTGCMPDPVVFSEVFQLGADAKLYTRYNIWYTDPLEINCLNIQQGAFIPIGTEIIPDGTDFWTNKIRFHDAEGKAYAIKFKDGYRVCSMRDYIKYTFTTQPAEELLAGLSPQVVERVRRGEVMPGMDQKAVILTYGPPAPIRTPDLRNETWIYWITSEETVRLVFRGDTVRQIININQR